MPWPTKQPVAAVRGVIKPPVMAISAGPDAGAYKTPDMPVRPEERTTSVPWLRPLVVAAKPSCAVVDTVALVLPPKL